MEIRIDEIKADFEAYAYRDDLDGETVKRYQQIIDDLPPVDVFNTEEGLILAGGYHRLEAHRQEGRETITANIHQGTVFEAKMFACKANAQHGLNMTASERKRALMDFIKFSLAEDPYLSNYNIARSYGGTSEASVRRYRKSLEESGEIERLTERRGADGRVIETGNIGEATPSTDAVNNSATSGEDSVQQTETAEESEEASTDMVASSPTDPATIRLRQEKEDKKAYAEIVLWLNTYARDLGGFNLTFNGLIREYGVPKIATALEVLNTEHRVDDLATQCYLILEKIEKIGGKVDGEQVLTVAHAE